jgi:hypothetical protein
MTVQKVKSGSSIIKYNYAVHLVAAHRRDPLRDSGA